AWRCARDVRHHPDRLRAGPFRPDRIDTARGGFHLAPVNPDHVSAYALEVLAHFKGLNPEMGLAESIGALINMKEAGSEDDATLRRLTEKADNRCFEQAIPRTSALQHASRFNDTERSYDTKYPGRSGEALESACRELLARLAEANAAHRASP